MTPDTTPERLPEPEAAYLAHLIGRVRLLETVQHAQEHLQAYLAYLQATHELPDGSQIAPDGAIVRPPTPT